MPPTLAAARITRWGLWVEKKDSTSDWFVRSRSEWSTRRRLVKPRWVSFRTRAEPTRPRWPATKILADLSSVKGSERERGKVYIRVWQN